MSTQIVTGRTLANPEGNCEVVKDPCVLLDSDSDTVTSATFEVGETIKQLKVFFLEPGRMVHLEMVYGPNGGTEFTDFLAAGVVPMSGAIRYMLVPWPGRYRVRYTGTPGTALVICEDVPCCNAQIIGANNG
jgi:hypothetical protein